MDSLTKKEIRRIIDSYNVTGPVWKSNDSFHSGEYHLVKRKRRNEIPEDWDLRDYDNLILKIMNNLENEIHLYYLIGFMQEYIVFDDGKWMVIVGKDKVMETCMFRKNTSSYLKSEDGYNYLGKVREVFE
ncbi:hypothetical protein PY093_16465 [Cytobacillus sp. S13-E01]|uniref:hypothetical protein n=1 Tax=Cytobacillus sp. S13-E01 TaxID=3031326 RepID=UPI0023D7D6D8|nr:hypothetical protein [Cytobacillus sp. S13-E01]MDF0728260.1 hypothetical protein [Cytobacillus sp. S13-E01]